MTLKSIFERQKERKKEPSKSCSSSNCSRILFICRFSTPFVKDSFILPKKPGLDSEDSEDSYLRKREFLKGVL